MSALAGWPGNPATLSEWGRRVGASERTLSRLFAVETGLTFVQWRRQLRLRRALELLAQGRSVSAVSLEVGYQSLSAFVTMFRKGTGQRPSEYRRSALGGGP